MKKFTILLFLLAIGIAGVNAQTTFLNKASSTYPGVKGKVTYSPTAGFKQYSWDDVTRVNSGATFELMTREMVKDNSGLYCVKIKIIDDNGTGKFNGKVGFMFGASTSLSDDMDYTTGRIKGGSSSSSSSGGFLDKAKSTYPGVCGTITFSPTAGFKQYSWDDVTRVNEGATFELLTRTLVADASGLLCVKIKIKDDNGTGKFNGKIGYVFGASTSLSDNMDYTAERIDGGSACSSGSSSKSSSGGSFKDQVSSNYPDIYGTVTFSPTAGFKQYSWSDVTRVNEGATFELLNREMAKDASGLYCVKIKILEDNGDGSFNGKVGYMFGASTSLSDRMNYTTGEID
ncbi:MAG: hypothetical protein M0D57_07185 [Sphingobacteriales bacterium JAD_PAG50586_3]|nr:MAG: hypothetical protein M0D57_07185 [Sphingobacteriales bacterium JAD_PAG50586_3]